MIAGERFAGGQSLDGRIEGLSATVTVAGVEVRFQHVGVGDETEHDLAVILDGRVQEFQPSQAGTVQRASFPSTIGGGEHRVEVRTLRGETKRVPDYHGAPYGKRAFLRWPRSTSTDAREYVIYSNNGTGSVNTTTPLATVSAVNVQQVYAGSGTGTGSGRLTVFGAWEGVAVNAQFTVETSAGTYRHNVSGAFSGWLPIPTGTQVVLPFGLAMVFEDARAAYVDLDFVINVGPLTEWESGDLVEGNWLFTVAARDAAGNQSATLTAVPVTILHRPNPVSDLEVVYDPEETNPVRLSWTPPADGDLDEIRIYSNLSNTFARLAENVLLDAPWVTVAADAEGYEFDPAVQGTYKFLVRTVDVNGRESESVEEVTVSTTGLPTGVRLNVPEQVTAIARAAGALRVEWVYRRAGGEDATRFLVYVHTNPAAPVFASPVVVSYAATGGPVDYLALDLAGPYTGARGFTVRAATATLETTNTDVVTGTPDATAPTFTGSIQGVPN